MVPENAFTDKEENLLESLNLSYESSLGVEWVVRDEADPDNLLLVFVTPGDGQLQAACSCSRGARDLPCAHALGVFRQVRADEQILKEIFKLRGPTPKAEITNS